MNEQFFVDTTVFKRVEGLISVHDVLRDPEMTVEEKRALLASWASDARVVEGRPACRRLDDGALLDIDDILYGLKALDAMEEVTPTPTRREQRWLGFARRRGIVSRLKHGPRRGDRDDDDDPPPCPAAAHLPRPLPVLNGGAALQVA